MKEYYLFTFDSTHCAIQAQKLLRNLNVVMMPTLREISASCGISLKVQPPQRKEASELLKQQVAGWHLYHIFQDGNKVSHELIAEKGGKL